jgi:hypothetical protein
MAEKKKLEDVFKTVGLPPYTYVKPAYYGEVRADISASGKHLLIEGPSGIGKTCVAFKVFEELGWAKDDRFSYVSCRDGDGEERINAFFEIAAKGEMPKPSLMVIDDFHLLSVDKRAEIGSSLKRMSDRAFERDAPPKAILIGIPTTGVSLLSKAYDLGPRLGTYLLSRASDTEIDRLISEGETALNVLFEDRNVLLSESAGNFWLAQYVCNRVCATHEVFETQDDAEILTFDLLGIRQGLMAGLAQRYLPTQGLSRKARNGGPAETSPTLRFSSPSARSRNPSSRSTNYST